MPPLPGVEDPGQYFFNVPAVEEGRLRHGEVVLGNPSRVESNRYPDLVGEFLDRRGVEDERVPKAPWDAEGSRDGGWPGPITIIADLEVTAKTGRQRHNPICWQQAGLFNAIVGVGLGKMHDVQPTKHPPTAFLNETR